MALIPMALPCPRATAPRRAVPNSPAPGPVPRRGLRGAFAGLALTAAKVATAKAVPEKVPEAVEVEVGNAGMAVGEIFDIFGRENDGTLREIVSYSSR